MYLSFVYLLSRFKERLHTCLVQITGHSSLFVSVEALRKEVFNSENQEHEAMLLKVRVPVFNQYISEEDVVYVLATWLLF